MKKNEYEISPLVDGKRWYTLSTKLRLEPETAEKLHEILRRELKLNKGICGMDDYSIEPEKRLRQGPLHF